jgi:hypothetical protein
MKRYARLFSFAAGLIAVLTGAFMASTALGIATAGALVALITLQLERSDT